MLLEGLTQEDIARKTKAVKQKLCQDYFDGELSLSHLIQIEKELAKQDEPESYLQAEAVRQAIEWVNNFQLPKK